MRVKLPASWHQIPISKFPVLYDILKDKDIDPIDKEIRVISELTGLSVTTVENISLDGLRALIKKVRFVFSMEVPKPVNEFKHAGYVWKINYDVTKLSGKDFISLSKYNEGEDSTMQNLVQITSLFVKPYRKKWFKLVEANLTEYEREDLISQAPVSVIYPMCVFFCKVLRDLLPVIQGYLENQEAKILNQIANELRHNTKSTSSTGDGS